MIDRWPRSALIWTGGALALLLVAAFVDHAVTYESLPEIDNFSEASQVDLEEQQGALDG